VLGLLPDEPVVLVRTIVVAVAAYFALVAILRLSGKRTLSQMNAFDFVITVALGSTFATIIISNDVSLLQGLLALLLLVALQFLITWTSQRSDTVGRLVKSEPTALLYRGEYLRDAMRRERILQVEIEAALRERGIAAAEEADLVVLETDGTFSVLASVDGRRSAIDQVNGIPGRTS
jgi:uncharacterized membrane protein YcaP (DUF421 family)